MLIFEQASKALRFATEAHKRQLIDGGEMAYIMHPISVALLVGAECTDLEPVPYNWSIETALLHDVKEDCPKFRDLLDEEFHPEVVQAVNALTKDKLPGDTERSLDMILRLPVWVRYVKLADRTVNLDPSTIPPSWSKAKKRAYRDESKLILDTLRIGTNHKLEVRLARTIEAYPID